MKNLSARNNITEPDDDKGEVIAFMRDIGKESKSMMKDLTDIDATLLSLHEKISVEDIKKEEILKDIESIRLKIGVLEREDRREMSEEEIAESLLSKLKKWVDMVV